MSVETVEMRWPGENGWPYMKAKSDKKPVTAYTLSDSFAKDYLTSSTRKAAPVLRTGQTCPLAAGKCDPPERERERERERGCSVQCV